MKTVPVPQDSGRVSISIPPEAARVITEIERLGLKYDYVPHYDITGLDPERRVQVRESDHYAPESLVKQYREALKGGATFPPGVISADAYLIDFNTRLRALLKNGATHYQVLIVRSTYEGASPETAAKLKALAATLNQQGGQRLSNSEAREAGKFLVSLGWQPAQIARALGLSTTVASKLKKEDAALKRMAALGVVPPNVEHLAALGMPLMLSLNNEPYKRLVLLKVDADLSQREMMAIAHEVAKAGSDEDAINLLVKYRAENEERIRDAALTGEGKPTQLSLFRRALGGLMSFDGTPIEKLVDDDEERAKIYLDTLSQAMGLLEDIAAAQREALSDE